MSTDTERAALPAAYMLTKLQMVMPLFQEARDALTALTEAQRKLHGISPTLADRMDEAGTFSLDDWQARAAIAQQPAPLLDAFSVRNACPRGYNRCGFDGTAQRCVAEGCGGAAIAQPAEPSEVDRLNAERLDLAMLIIRLCQRMRAAREGRGIAAGDDALEQQALGYLKRKGIVGSPLRADGDEAQADAQPVAPTARQPLTDEQALDLARKHLDKGLSWAPHITRCTDLEIRALIRAIEAAHGITQEGE
jgi:hypothetical protein